MPEREGRSYRTQAIVLGHMEFGEADRILRLFTLERGKITAIAKGVRKIRSRKAGHLEPFTEVTLFMAMGRNMDIITQAETINPHMGLRQDLQLVGMAAYVLEVLDCFTFEEGQNIAMFRLLSNTLTRLESQADAKTVVHYYELRLLDLLGFRPQLFSCIDCRETIIEQDQYFSPLAGGVACPKCGRLRSEAWPVEKDVLRYLRHLQRSNWQSVESLIIPPAVEAHLNYLIERYLTYLLERKLNTPAFLREIRGNSHPSDED